MLVHVLADNAAKLSDLCRVLDRRFRIAAERLDVDAKLSQVPHAVVVRADLRLVENIAALKRRSARLTKIPKRIFLVEEPSHVCISQAYALGATLALPGTVNPAKLFAALADPANAESALLTGEPQRDHAIEVAATAIGSMFTAVSLGEPIDVIGTKEAGRKIADRIAERGLAEWLATVRRHHEGTYQHCLLVTGIAIDFGGRKPASPFGLRQQLRSLVLHGTITTPARSGCRRLGARLSFAPGTTGPGASRAPFPPGIFALPRPARRVSINEAE